MKIPRKKSTEIILLFPSPGVFFSHPSDGVVGVKYIVVVSGGCLGFHELSGGCCYRVQQRRRRRRRQQQQQPPSSSKRRQYLVTGAVHRTYASIHALADPRRYPPPRRFPRARHRYHPAPPPPPFHSRDGRRRPGLAAATAPTPRYLHTRIYV